MNKINSNTNTNANPAMAAKIIKAAINALNAIEDDWVGEDEYCACWIKMPGKGWEYNIEAAEERQAFAEKLVFDTMRRLNKPLYGWIQFGRFVTCFEHGMSLDAAYRRAQQEQAIMDINICGGTGTEEDPFICEYTGTLSNEDADIATRRPCASTSALIGY